MDHDPGGSAMKNASKKEVEGLRARRKAPLRTPSDLSESATTDISGALNALLADVFALYLKTKNFHWHMSGPHFLAGAFLPGESGGYGG
jgi:starvation-inducible DNA-binding protein